MKESREGRRVPSTVFRTREGDRWVDVSSDEIFAAKTVVVFALPGAFTPTCSSTHLPRYEELSGELFARGVDEILCVSVNDAFVMNAWKEDQRAEHVRVLPDGNGVEVCEALRTYAPDVRTLVLTSFCDDDTLFAAIDAGAAGFVLKRLDGDELIDSVRCVHEGTSVIDPRLTDRMFNRLRARESTDEERLAELNDREHQLLELVAEGLTNRQIGARLYLSEKTVKNYVSAMLQKLNMRTRTEAAVFATRLAARRQAETTPQRSG